MTKDIFGILLAAGSSTRFGSHKLLHRLTSENLSIIEQSARRLLMALPHCVAVVRPNDEPLKELITHIGMVWTENAISESGMSSSIRCGINFSLNGEITPTGWLIALADMPFVPSPVIQKVAAAISSGSLIAAPVCQHQRGHPVGFSYKLKNELEQLRGDMGAKSLLQKHHSQIKLINTSNEGVLRDIDTPNDL